MSTKSKQDPKYGPLYGFAIKTRRSHPPIDDCDAREWSRRTQTRNYIQRIKKSVQMVDTYLLTVRKWPRGLSGHQVDACHYFTDVATFDSERRARGNRTTSDPAKETAITDSLKY